MKPRENFNLKEGIAFLKTRSWLVSFNDSVFEYGFTTNFRQLHHRMTPSLTFRQNVQLFFLEIFVKNMSKLAKSCLDLTIWPPLSGLLHWIAPFIGTKSHRGATRMARGGIRLVHGHTKSTLITYFSGIKIDPKYAFLHAFFLICPSCPLKNLSIWPKTHPFFQFCTFLHP